MGSNTTATCENTTSTSVSSHAATLASALVIGRSGGRDLGTALGA